METRPEHPPRPGPEERPPDLRRRIVALLLLVSLLPLALVAAGAWISFGRMTTLKTRELQRSSVRLHADAIDRYLAERLRAVQMISLSHAPSALTEPRALERLLQALNTSYPSSFLDLGVIGPDGRHLAYVGPYDLASKNYTGAEWFNVVQAQGAFVSDVFLGYRKVPHFVVAVRGGPSRPSWVLRATVNSDAFNLLVSQGRLGETGQAFIVDTQGHYQSPPRGGRVLGASPMATPAPFKGVEERRARAAGREVVQTLKWVNGDRWLLVIQQDEAEIMSPVHGAMALGAVVLVIAMVRVVGTTVMATGHLTRQIDQANAQRDDLARDMMRSAKLASLGEMATGLAHEINNPLAIISAEQTNIADQVEDLRVERQAREGLLASVQRCQRQVGRCSSIVSKMLQFGRKTEARPQPTDLRPLLEDVVEMMRKQAAVRNVDISLRVAAELPRVVLDATELQQVLTNLINNSLYAIEGQGSVQIAALVRGREVMITVHDDGGGIEPEAMEHIFQPFFTTKPVGQGTGLGLSVCHGIVRRWGGSIDAQSEPGVGTVITIRLPLQTWAEAPPLAPRGPGPDPQPQEERQ